MLDLSHLLARLCVPQPDEVVKARGCCEFAIGREGHAVHAARPISGEYMAGVFKRGGSSQHPVALVCILLVYRANAQESDGLRITLDLREIVGLGCQPES